METIERNGMGAQEALDSGQGAATSQVEAPPAAPPRRSSAARWVLPLVLLAFIGGIAVAFLALPDLVARWRSVAVTTTRPRLPATPRNDAPRDARPVNAATQDLLAVRMTDLEDRMVRINVAAQAAAGNAARAEGLLVAFAARRALDSAAPLGYIEGQLRLRFGQAQPRAVATIINAAREPVTLTDLQTGFEDIAPKLRVNPPGTSWWRAMQSELRALVVVRKSSTPSPQPDRALPRITRLLATGRVDAAMAEVERLPGKAAADRWLQMARRYREARRALDLIETAAILESRPISSSDGAATAQTPLPLP